MNRLLRRDIAAREVIRKGAVRLLEPDEQIEEVFIGASTTAQSKYDGNDEGWPGAWDRVVVLTDRSIVLFEKSLFTGRPCPEILARLPRRISVGPEQGPWGRGFRKVRLGHVRHVWVKWPYFPDVDAACASVTMDR